jgi:hypothetical protein
LLAGRTRRPGLAGFAGFALSNRLPAEGPDLLRERRVVGLRLLELLPDERAATDDDGQHEGAEQGEAQDSGVAAMLRVLGLRHPSALQDYG